MDEIDSMQKVMKDFQSSQLLNKCEYSVTDLIQVYNKGVKNIINIPSFKIH